MTRSEVRVAPVANRETARDFVDLPYELYRDDPHWVPPLRFSERQRWLPAHNPSLRTRRLSRFVALRDGRVVGRIAAIMDDAFVSKWEPGTGFFGFFESADSEASDRLFATAHAWLREQGASSALGPVNLSTHEEVGLLVDGFGSSPMILSPYNPPRYEQYVLAAGYAPERDYYAYEWTPAARPAPAIDRLARGAARGTGIASRIRVRPADPRRWDAEVRTLWTLYNGAFTDLWGFVPMTWEEFAARAVEFRPFYRPELVLIAEVDGAPVGFGLVLPDVNAALRKVGGRLFPFGWLRLMRDVPKIRTARFILAGVLPEFTGLGVAPLLAHAMDQAARRSGLESAELSLVQQNNMRMRHVIESFGCRPCKTYRLYERRL